MFTLRVRPSSLGFLALAFGASACTEDVRWRNVDNVNDGSIVSYPTGTVPSPSEGSPCASIGQTSACDLEKVKTKDFVICGVGEQLCRADGTWSKCKSTENTDAATYVGESVTLSARGENDVSKTKCDSADAPWGYAPEQSRSYIFQASCAASRAPLWTVYRWLSRTPDKTSLLFDARAADTESGLAGAPFRTLATSSGEPVSEWAVSLSDPGIINVAESLGAAGHKRFLEVRVTLRASASSCSTPTLVHWRQSYTCKDSE